MAVDLGPVSGPSNVAVMSFTAGSGSRSSNVIDMVGYVNAVAYFTSTGGGGTSINAQFSHDGSTWFTPGMSFDYMTNSAWSNAGSFSSIGGMAGNNYYFTFPLYGRYMRLNLSSGTTTGTYNMQVTGHNGPLPPSTSIYQKMQGTTSPGDGYVPTTIGLQAHGLGMGYIGATTNAWQKLRVPNVFKSASINAIGNTTVWSPAGGLKFRLMRYKMWTTNNATITGGGEQVIQFNDAGTNLPFLDSVYLPGTATGTIGGWSSGWVDLGNGYVASAALASLNVSVTANMSAGLVRVLVAGVEEL